MSVQDDYDHDESLHDTVDDSQHSGAEARSEVSSTMDDDGAPFGTPTRHIVSRSGYGGGLALTYASTAASSRLDDIPTSVSPSRARAGKKAKSRSKSSSKSIGSYSQRRNSHKDTGKDTDRNATRSIVNLNMNANTDTKRTNPQGHDHTHDHGSYHWNGRDDNRSMTSTITSIPTTVADRDRGSHAGAHKSNTNTRTDTNSNFNSSANYRPQTPPQTPDSTLKVKEIIGSLSTVLGSVKNLDSLDAVQEIEMWKERALLAEVNITSLKGEIESLKKEVTVWENRTKRIEKRCDRIKQGLKEREERKLLRPYGVASSDEEDIGDGGTDDDTNGFDKTRLPHEPSENLKAFIHGRSFRSKWDRKRLSGVEDRDDNDKNSVGESTMFAQRYVQEYMDSHPREREEPSFSYDDEVDPGNDRDNTGGTRDGDANGKIMTKPGLDLPRHMLKSKRHWKKKNEDEELQWAEI